MSPPSRRRGLKLTKPDVAESFLVASFAEAWIEIVLVGFLGGLIPVASFAEAWIEIG